MSASLVGSEMCIRDSAPHTPHAPCHSTGERRAAQVRSLRIGAPDDRCACLLYTSDAADDM
eukprot:208579-Alexandrium_andersonii.AAC.1